MDTECRLSRRSKVKKRQIKTAAWVERQSLGERFRRGKCERFYGCGCDKTIDGERALKHLLRKKVRSTNLGSR